jgi:hypothetical protein
MAEGGRHRTGDRLGPRNTITSSPTRNATPDADLDGVPDLVNERRLGLRAPPPA